MSDHERMATGTLVCTRLDDQAAHERAIARVAEVFHLAVGPTVTWDPVHLLQGHTCVAGLDLVVIAPRDTAHEALIVTEDDWDDLRRAASPHRSLAVGERSR